MEELKFHQEVETYPGTPQPKPGELTIRQKIEAIKKSSLAGFLATTQGEKTDAITLLDYSNSSHTKIFPQRGLNEIFLHQKKNKQVDTPEAAIVSKVFEWGDYLDNATKSIKHLNSLGKIVNECLYPYVLLTEEVDRVKETVEYNHPGYRPLVRYLDLMDLMEAKFDFKKLGFGPLYNYEKELDNPINFLGFTKRKEIEDEYSSSVTKSEVDKHIVDVIKSLTIAELRNVVDEAITDQQNRIHFWTNIIEETKKHKAKVELEDGRKVLIVKEVAQLVLAELTHQVE